MLPRTRKSRQGGIYIVVLGTAMIVAMLGLAALVGQRLQNRMLTMSADVRHAQLNAHTAVELALLTMKQDANWRTTQTNGTWFSARGTGAGTCTLAVTDPVDSNLADDANEPLLVRGIGYSGKAEQRFDVYVDPQREPLACLRYGVAAADIDLQGDTLRSSATISANTTSANSSQVHGKVEAVSISGSTYHTGTSQVEAAKRPAMPDWATVFNYYRTNGTQISIGNLASSLPNMCWNTSFDSDSSYWSGTATGLPSASVTRETGVSGHSAALRVHNRSANTAGASQAIDTYVKPSQSYTVTFQVYAPSSWGNAFRVKICTKGVGSASQTNAATAVLVGSGGWEDVSVSVSAPNWSGELDYARITIDTDHFLGTTNSFYIDNIDIREVATGRFIYRQVLSPSINPFGGTANSQGIYWINCAGNKVTIERSRILGTLLIVNPGPGSCIGNGPVHMSPAVAGYPALLVDADNTSDADFAIYATNLALNERENATNFNPAGAPHEDFGQDNDQNDIYQSAIIGLVAIEDDLTFQNTPLIRGQLLVGDDISNSSGTLEIQYQPASLLNPPPGFWGNYTYLRRPISGKKAVLP